MPVGHMMRTLRDALVLCLLAAIPVGITGFLHRDLVLATPPISQGEATLEMTRQWGGRVLWLDARSQKKYEKEHVPGALSLNEDRWEDSLLPVVEGWTKDKMIVVYCNEDSCDAGEDVAARLRKEMGWTNIYVLKGGWQAWKQAQGGR